MITVSVWMWGLVVLAVVMVAVVVAQLVLSVRSLTASDKRWKLIEENLQRIQTEHTEQSLSILYLTGLADNVVRATADITKEIIDIRVGVTTFLTSPPCPPYPPYPPYPQEEKPSTVESHPPSTVDIGSAHSMEYAPVASTRRSCKIVRAADKFVIGHRPPFHPDIREALDTPGLEVHYADGTIESGVQ